MSIIQLKDMASMGTKSYNPSFKTDFRARTRADLRKEDEFERKRAKEEELDRLKKDFAEAKAADILAKDKSKFDSELDSKFDSELSALDAHDKFIASKRKQAEKDKADQDSLKVLKNQYDRAKASLRVKSSYDKLQSYQSGPEEVKKYNKAAADLKRLGGSLPQGTDVDAVIDEYEKREQQELMKQNVVSDTNVSKYDSYSSEEDRSDIASERAAADYEVSSEADVAAKRALADPFDKMSRAEKRFQTDADVQRELKSSPEARAAHSKYIEGRTELATAITNGNEQDVLKAQIKINEANGAYFKATKGLSLREESGSTLSNAAKAKADAAKAKADFEQKQKDSKIKDRKEMSELVKYGDGRLDTFRKDKEKTLQAYDGAKKAKAMLVTIAKDRSPESLFATVKALALIMEPMSAVTDGEVNGFLGKSGAQDIINIGIAVKEGMSAMQKGSNVEEAAYKMGNGSETAVKKLQKLATTMYDNMTLMLSSIANMGAADFVTYLGDDLKIVFGETIDSTKLKKLIANFKKKLGSRLPVKPKGDITKQFVRVKADNSDSDGVEWEYLEDNGKKYKKVKGTFAWQPA